MPEIYRDFARAFEGLNDRLTSDLTVAVPGGRAYLRRPPVSGGGSDRAPENLKPYLDQVHLPICDEYWWTHHQIRDRLTADTASQGRVYAGCAGVVNLEYITATRAPAAILYDINPLQRVFWQDFFALLAKTPENARFAESLPALQQQLYYKLEKRFDREAISSHMRPPVKDEQNRWGGPDAQSPFRRIRYDQMAGWADHYLAGHEAAKTWLGNPDKFRHLHLLAKFNAVAFMTLDIRDRAGCRDIARALADATYRRGTYQDGALTVKFARAATKGAKVGLLYRSNVGHYLKWSRKELEEMRAEGREPVDFSGRPASISTWRQVRESMRAWFDPQGAGLIAADRHSGGSWGQFRPVLSRVTGPPAPGS